MSLVPIIVESNLFLKTKTSTKKSVQILKKNVTNVKENIFQTKQEK